MFPLAEELKGKLQKKFTEEEKMRVKFEVSIIVGLYIVQSKIKRVLSCILS